MQIERTCVTGRPLNFSHMPGIEKGATDDEIKKATG